VIAQSLPAFRPPQREARRRLPSRGSRGPRFPTFTGTLLREADLPARLGSLRLALASRYLACCRACVVSHRDAQPGGSPQAPPGPGGARSPSPGMSQGDRWFSHVPTSPLGRPALLSDPGGVLGTRLLAPRTAAFRPLETVGVLLETSLRRILLSTTLRISGLHHTACILATPGSVPPRAETHAGSLLTCWLGFRPVGLEPYRLAPTG